MNASRSRTENHGSTRVDAEVDELRLRRRTADRPESELEELTADQRRPTQTGTGGFNTKDTKDTKNRTGDSPPSQQDTKTRNPEWKHKDHEDQEGFFLILRGFGTDLIPRNVLTLHVRVVHP